MTQPLLTTARFDLWLPQAGDHAAIDAMMGDPRTLTFLGQWQPSPADSFARVARNAGSWALYGYGTFYVRPRGAAQIIANCGVFHSWRGFAHGLDDTPEAGWIVHPDHWGQGLAGEVMDAAMAWFDQTHGARRIACMIEDGHAVSERLAQRLGFVRYARHQQPGEKPLGLYERGAG